jgi:hypothetical protein
LLLLINYLGASPRGIKKANAHGESGTAPRVGVLTKKRIKVFAVSGKARITNPRQLGDLIEEYRLLFIDWVAGFDKWNYYIDRWGLFNPPGVGPFDKDPDNDIPFNPDDFFS